MLGRFAHFLLKKNGNAALAAFLCSILPAFFGTLSILIVALVTLRKGTKDGFFVLAWGVLPLLARAFVAKDYLFFAATVITFVLVWGMAALLRRYSSWSMLLEVSALLGIGAVAVTYIFQESIIQWWVLHINEYVQMVVKSGYVDAGEVFSQVRIHWLAQLASGAEVLLVLLFAGLKLSLARWWEARVFKTSGLRKELLQARLDRWALLLFVVLLLAALVFKTMSFIDVLLPLAGFYVVTGLCMLHYWMQGYKYARSALLGFYIVLIIFPYVMVFALILGLIDSGLNLRVRISEV